MAESYTVRLPNGTEYGPADLEAIRTWYAQGRVGAEALVWREAHQDWLPLAQVIEGKGSSDSPPDETGTFVSRPLVAPAVPPAEPGAPAVPTEAAEPAAAPEPPPTPAETISPARAVPVRRARRQRRSPLWVAVPVGLVVLAAAGVAAWWTLGAPARERQRAEGEIRSYALVDRHFADPALGLSVDLPEGWIALQPDHPFFQAPDAKLRLALPALRAFARLSAHVRPRGPATLDASLDRTLSDWRLLVPGVRDEARADVVVSGLPARRAMTAWSADGAETKGLALAWQDGWYDFDLRAWAPAASAVALNPAVEALVSHVHVAGNAAATIQAAADAVAPEMPELSRPSVEALVLDRLRAGQATDDLPQSCLRAVSRGLSSLSGEESREMGRIYELVYKPLKEKERARFAAWLSDVRLGRAVAPEEGSVMRQALRDGVLALPEDTRLRLQSLNDRAIAAALAQP